jgi:hypothetical protein
MFKPEVKFTGLDFVPTEYFLAIRFRGDDFYRIKSMKYAIKSVLKKY